MVLPLHRTGQITVGNALRLNWLDVCPPPIAQTAAEHDLAGPTGRLALEVGGLGEGAGAETYICGNPPYLGAKKKSDGQVEDMEIAGLRNAKLLDYVAAFIMKGLAYMETYECKMALVSTSSICQGEQVSLLWPRVLNNANIVFAYAPFKWANSAARNAGVFCTIVGLQRLPPRQRLLFGEDSVKACDEISPYLIEGKPVICKPATEAISKLSPMVMGSNPVDGKRLILEREEARALVKAAPAAEPFLRPYGGTEELVSGLSRFCVWIDDERIEDALSVSELASIVERCREYRLDAGRDAKKAARRPHAFCYSTFRNEPALHVGNTIGNAYSFVPAALLQRGYVSSHAAFTIYGKPLIELAIVCSTLHLVWAEAVAGRLGNGVRYGNTVVYNTFPVPKLTEQNRFDLTHAAENILLTREAHFPATIADLYDPEKMPDDLRRAHDENDEVLERIYIGRRFRNDTERLEKLFELYAKIAAEQPQAKKGRKAA